MANLVAAYERVLQAYELDTGERFVPNAPTSAYSQSVPFDDLSQKFPPLQKATAVQEKELILNSRDYLKALRLLKSEQGK